MRTRRVTRKKSERRLRRGSPRSPQEGALRRGKGCRSQAEVRGGGGAGEERPQGWVSASTSTAGRQSAQKPQQTAACCTHQPTGEAGGLTFRSSVSPGLKRSLHRALWPPSEQPDLKAVGRSAPPVPATSGARPGVGVRAHPSLRPRLVTWPPLSQRPKEGTEQGWEGTQRVRRADRGPGQTRGWSIARPWPTHHGREPVS